MISVIFFFCLPNVEGGVASVVRNLVQNNPSNSNVELITYYNTSNPRTKANFRIIGEVKVNEVEYSNDENIFKVLRKIKSTLSKNNKSCVVATDAIELKAVNEFQLNLPIVFIVLGDFKYYYNLAVKYEGIIDSYIAISDEIQNNLRSLLPARYQDIKRLYFPTPEVHIQKQNINTKLVNKVIWVGRLEAAKNPNLLFEIDQKLKAKNVVVDWTLVGDGELRFQFESIISQKALSNFHLVGMLDNYTLQEMYNNHAIFIMTTLSEGLPVSLIEAMKCGTIPVVSNIKGGVREIVKQDVNGYICDVNSSEEYCDAIYRIIKDKKLYKRLSSNAQLTSITTFNAKTNSENYFRLIQKTINSTKVKSFTSLATNRLDIKYIPSFIVYTLRRLLTLLKKII